jgi:hypothetical protein
MSSGVGSLFERLLGSRRRIDRLARLRASGCTVQLAAVPAEARVIEIDLGFGYEVWLVQSGELRFTSDRAIAAAKLVVEGERPASSTIFFQTTGRRPDRVLTRL